VPTFNIRITFMDGTETVVEYADGSHVRDEVLHIFRDRQFSGGREHLGSFPLVNVRKWKTEER
jgi:hypothetical protein